MMSPALSSKFVALCIALGISSVAALAHAETSNDAVFKEEFIGSRKQEAIDRYVKSAAPDAEVVRNAKAVAKTLNKYLDAINNKKDRQLIEYVRTKPDQDSKYFSFVSERLKNIVSSVKESSEWVDCAEYETKKIDWRQDDAHFTISERLQTFGFMCTRIIEDSCQEHCNFGGNVVEIPVSGYEKVTFEGNYTGYHSGKVADSVQVCRRTLALDAGRMCWSVPLMPEKIVYVTPQEVYADYTHNAPWVGETQEQYVARRVNDAREELKTH